MSSRNRAKRGHRDRDRGRVQGAWDDSRQQEYYANDHSWVFKDGTSIPYEEAVTQVWGPDIRVPRSALDTSYDSEEEGNDLNFHFSKLDVSQEDYHHDKSEYPQSYDESLTDEHYEPHYTSRTQRPDSFEGEQNGSAAQGPTPQPHSGPPWVPQETTYEAQNNAMEQHEVFVSEPTSCEDLMEQHLSTSFEYPVHGAQQDPLWPLNLTYDGRPQHPSYAQQAYPSTYPSSSTYGAQQFGDSYESQYDTPQRPYPNPHNAPYSIIYSDDTFDSPRHITHPRLYKKGITAVARLSLDRTQKTQKTVGVELRACARLGTVFKIPWSELSRMKSDHDQVEFERKGPFRWFVVVLEPSHGTQFYSCIPITTYRGQGSQKAGIVLSAHAQIGAQYLVHVNGMGKTIGFKPKFHGSSMPYGSLVNFKEIYTIDHDVRAVELGNVDQDQRQSLLTMLERSWSTAHANVTEEERNRRQVEDRNRWERNQDDFADD